jgi:hypothetical protein
MIVSSHTNRENYRYQECHSRAGGNPGSPVKTGIQFHIFMVLCIRRHNDWIPTSAGMTGSSKFLTIYFLCISI